MPGEVQAAWGLLGALVRGLESFQGATGADLFAPVIAISKVDFGCQGTDTGTGWEAYCNQEAAGPELGGAAYILEAK